MRHYDFRSLFILIGLSVLPGSSVLAVTREHDHIGVFNFKVEVPSSGSVSTFPGVSAVDLTPATIDFLSVVDASGPGTDITYLSPVVLTGQTAWNGGTSFALTLDNLTGHAISGASSTLSTAQATLTMGGVVLTATSNVVLTASGDFAAASTSTWQLAQPVVFSFVGSPPAPTGETWTLDLGSTITTTLVPEPGVAVMLGLGLGVPVLRRRIRT